MRVHQRFGVRPAHWQIEMVDEAMYSIIRDSNQSCWHYIIGRMNIYADFHPLLCTLALLPGGELGLGINFSSFVQLSLESRKALLKYQVLRFTWGHLSSYGERLKKEFGRNIVDAAACMAIGQKLDLTSMWLDGYVLPEISLYDFPEDKDTELYCTLIKDFYEKRQQAMMQQIHSMQQILNDLMNTAVSEGADPNDPEVMARLWAEFSEKVKPGVEPPDGAAGDAGFDDGDTIVKVAASPEGTPPPDHEVSPEFTGPAWTPNHPPDWVRNGQIDKEMLQAAIDRGEVMPMGLGSTEMGFPPAVADAKAKDMLLAALNRSDLKEQGWFAGEGAEFVERLMRKPQLSWVTLLRQRERTHMSEDREPTRRRPSRRHPAYWGRRKTRDCRAYAWCDTSGSMGERELACISAELRGLSRRGTSVLVGQVDAGMANPPAPYNSRMQVEHFFGRGGTDFRPAFEWMAQQVERPDFVVYFTDGHGTAPEQPPEFMRECDILWVLTQDGLSPEDFRERVCPYGDAVVLDTTTDVDERFNRKGEIVQPDDT